MSTPAVASVWLKLPRPKVGGRRGYLCAPVLHTMAGRFLGMIGLAVVKIASP